jgi:hypothetical protein
MKLRYLSQMSLSQDLEAPKGGPPKLAYKVIHKKVCHLVNKTKDWAAVGHTNNSWAASQFWKKLEKWL